MKSNDIVEIDGLNALWTALISIPPATESAAQHGIDTWTSDEEARIKSAAAGVDAQARLAARSVRGAKGRISAGGGMRLGNGTAGDIFFGAEFGGGARPTTRQFRPYRPSGYWFFPTIESDQDTTLMEAAEDGLDAAADRWDN